MIAPKFHERASHIADDLRQAIVGQVYQPGDRVPTRDELTARYGVSKVTVQRALQALTDDGFLEPRGTRGTFVAHTSPHLTRYLLMLPETPEEMTRNHIWNALLREARATHGDKQFVYNWWDNKPANQEHFQGLLEDVEAHRIAGVIFAEPPQFFEGTSLVSSSTVARTAIASKPSHPDIPVVTFDYVSFFQRALEVLQRHGRRRPAFIMVGGIYDSIGTEQLPRMMAEYGMESPQVWQQVAHLSDRAWVGNLVRLLFDYPPEQRPDSLIIANDNFVEPVTQALAELGSDLVDHLDVVGQCNFPYPTAAHTPVHRVGFSVPQCLDLCMRNIDHLRKGENPPMQQFLKAGEAE